MSRKSVVYFMRPVGAEGPVKIGYSVSSESRLKTYTQWSPVPLEIVATIEGGGALERRFHAAFAEHHSHHEWFFPTEALTAAIEAIRAGSFDVETLPRPASIRARRPMPRSTVEACVFSRRLDALVRRGIKTPLDVLEARFTYGLGLAEVARRRAIVREFVMRFDPRPVGGATARLADAA